MLPDALLEGATSSGPEGITRAPDGTLHMVVQREWGDDPEGTAKIPRWTPGTEDWAAAL